MTSSYLGMELIFTQILFLLSNFVITIGVYLHDPRCICKEAKTKTRRKNKEDVVLDALFWPVMPYQMVAAKLDMNRQPHVIQSYSVPLPQPDQYRKHDTAVYSMWMHFVDFCLANSESTGLNGLRNADAAPCFCAPDAPVNSYTDEHRLKLFQFLAACNGRAVGREEFLRATAMALPASAAPAPVQYHKQHAPPSLVQHQQHLQQSLQQHRAAGSPAAAPVMITGYGNNGGHKAATMPSSSVYALPRPHESPQLLRDQLPQYASSAPAPAGVAAIRRAPGAPASSSSAAAFGQLDDTANPNFLSSEPALDDVFGFGGPAVVGVAAGNMGGGGSGGGGGGSAVGSRGAVLPPIMPGRAPLSALSASSQQLQQQQHMSPSLSQYSSSSSTTPMQQQERHLTYAPSVNQQQTQYVNGSSNGSASGMVDREKALRRLSKTSSQSASPVTITACDRSPHRPYNPATAAGSAAGINGQQQQGQYGASSSLLSQQLPQQPTSLSLLMNTVPQRSFDQQQQLGGGNGNGSLKSGGGGGYLPQQQSQPQQQQHQARTSLLLSQQQHPETDPWLLDSEYALSNTDDERDDGCDACEGGGAFLSADLFSYDTLVSSSAHGNGKSTAAVVVAASAPPAAAADGLSAFRSIWKSGDSNATTISGNGNNPVMFGSYHDNTSTESDFSM